MLLGTHTTSHFGFFEKCFNPQRGFMLLGTVRLGRCASNPICFNPQRGFMLLGTKATVFAPTFANMFQSPERIHAFGNGGFCVSDNRQCLVSIPREDSCFWEPEKADGWCFIMEFQSPERIHAFGNFCARAYIEAMRRFNPQRGFMLLGTPQSRAASAIRKSFNPQRGFMLLGTAFCHANGGRQDRFQSPERIHAFGNYF